MARFKAYATESEDEGTGPESSQHERRAPKPTGTTPRQPSYAVPESSSSSSEESVEDEVYVADEREEEDSSSDEEDDTAEGEEEEEAEVESTPWAKQLNLEPHRVQVMQTSLFRIPDLTKIQDKDNYSFLRHRRRLSDVLSEPKATRTRTSFSQPQSQPPPRKYVRVALSESVCARNENIFLDAGLSLGRSFRVGWGPGSKLVYVGGLNTDTSSPKSANSSTVTITKLKTHWKRLPNILEHLLTNCEFTKASEDNEDSPYATPKPGLMFSSFSSLYTAQDRSHCASVFRLGHALFDPLNLHVKDDVPPDIQDSIVALRRTDALSSWLSRTVSTSVEQDVKAAGSADSAQIAFLYLSGNQVGKAVQALMEGGNVRLATIISQIPGDEEFRRDIEGQVQIWKEEKVDAFMSEPIRKLYALAMRESDILDGSTRKESIDITKGLDWLRVLGMRLWYSSSVDTPLQESLDSYERLLEASNGRLAPPKPWHSNAPFSISGVKDGLFNLIKLSLSSTITLESALNPLSFSPNPRDYRMPWFLYVLVSRILRIRDFSDRQVYDAMVEGTDDTEQIEGYSQMANALTTNFSAQLQEVGDVQEAAFVLMFLEDDVLRRRAIREMICQLAPLLEEYSTAGLLGSLQLPEEWVDEAKATYALYRGDIYRAYELYVRAKVHQMAHELAVTYLAPEAVLRDELDALTRLFTGLDANLIDDFGVGGQLFIDYAHIVSRVPDLRENQTAKDAVPDAAEAEELEALSAKIPRLIAVLPDVLHDKPGTGEQCKAALSHMLAKLLDCVDPSVPMKVEMQPGLIDEGARIKHIHASAYASFMRTIEELT